MSLCDQAWAHFGYAQYIPKLLDSPYHKIKNKINQNISNDNSVVNL
jgi:hypothetical protein